MLLPKGPYKPQETEDKILKFWMDNKYYKPEFKSDKKLSTSNLPKRKTYSNILPPPNANGNLHLGHMSGYVYQDLMGRFQRMNGKEVLLLPGKDHAGIQTEVVFEKILNEKGKTKQDLGRDKFYNLCFDFCMEQSDTARKQEQKLGLSADFDRELFTLDPKIVNNVLQTFVDMYEDDLIYRDKRIINWCVRCESALADIDTEYKDSKTPLIYFKYAFTTPEKKALKIRDTYQNREIEWEFISDTVTNSEDKLPFKFGKTSDGKDLNVLAIGYDDKNFKKSDKQKSKAFGIFMRLDGDFELIVINPKLKEADTQSKLRKVLEFEFPKVAGAHIIEFEKYPEDKFYTNGFILATVRPETKFGDTALAVNPKDARYKKYVGKSFEVQTLTGTTKIHVIADRAVEKDFGTGMLKITPAHAREDWDIAKRHEDLTFPEKQVINFDGTLNHITQKYEGLKIKEARKKITSDMEDLGILVLKVDEYKNRIQICERCKHPIEPLISYQWFLDTAPLKKRAKEIVEKKITKIMPSGKEKVYLNWMDTPEDWCITRQLWWGYRVPVWYPKQPTEYITETGEVKEKIGETVINTKKDYKKITHVGLTPPQRLILIPGKHGYTLTELFPEIQTQFPQTEIVQIENFHNPSYKEYEKKITELNLNENDIVVGHSLGAGSITRYLTEHLVQIKHLILLAPPAQPRKKDLQTKYIKAFFHKEDSINLDGKAAKVSMIYSDNDPLMKKNDFEVLGAKFDNIEMYLEENKGHYADKETTNHSKTLHKILKEEITPWYQDEDVFDTWFSSGQWPFVTLAAKDGDLEKFYPTQVMETGWDIIIFWVTRMMLLCAYKAEKHAQTKLEDKLATPFKDVYLHGLVLDKNGVKMSKSKGNGIDPFFMMDKYGTDALRLSFVVGNKIGQNYRLYEEKIESFRNYCNKIWNISKFTLMNIESSEKEIYSLDPKDLLLESVDKDMIKHIDKLCKDTTRRMNKFNFGLAAEEIYKSIWHEFADIYLEQIKPRIYTKDKSGNPINTSAEAKQSREAALWTLWYSLDKYLRILHPFIPFLSEEIWQHFPKSDQESETLMYAKWPK